MREKSILKATRLELYVSLILGGLVFVLAVRMDSILLYAQATSSFIGGAIAYSNLRFIKKNSLEKRRLKRLINGRKEYFFNITLSIVLIYFGISFFREGFHSDHLEHFDPISLGIIALVSIIKFFLGSITLKEGKEYESTSLKIIGLITRNEAFIGMLNVLTLSGIFTDVPNLSGITIITMSIIMILTGIRTISYYKRVLIGLGIDENKLGDVYRVIKESSFVIDVDDLIVHDYGYSNKIATVNIVLKDDITIDEFYRELESLKANVYEACGFELIPNIVQKR